MMKFYFITLPVIAVGMFMCPPGAHAQNAVPMVKAATSVSIDGNIVEWGGTLAGYDTKSKLNYTIANNDSMIYIAATSVDRTTKRKIMVGGLTVSINTEGKKKKTFSITYPEMGSVAPMRREDGQAPAAPTGIKISGFKGIDDKVTNTANTYGFKGALKFDEERNLGYELAIPVKLLGIKPGTDLFINISVNGFDPEVMRKGSNTGSFISKPTGGRGGRGGGSSAGADTGPPGGGGGGDDDMTESIDFWVKMTPVH